MIHGVKNACLMRQYQNVMQHFSMCYGILKVSTVNIHMYCTSSTVLSVAGVGKLRVVMALTDLISRDPSVL